jgi:hypothetical protein
MSSRLSLNIYGDPLASFMQRKNNISNVYVCVHNSIRDYQFSI